MSQYKPIPSWVYVGMVAIWSVPLAIGYGHMVAAKPIERARTQLFELARKKPKPEKEIPQESRGYVEFAPLIPNASELGPTDTFNSIQSNTMVGGTIMSGTYYFDTTAACLVITPSLVSPTTTGISMSMAKPSGFCLDGGGGGGTVSSFSTTTIVH